MNEARLSTCGYTPGRWAPLWVYAITTVPIASIQLGGDADWWLRLVITAAAILANFAIITAVQRRWRPWRFHC